MATNTEWLSRKLILVMGKGGVGKSSVAEAAAQTLASQGRKTLLVHILQLADEPQVLEQIAPNLFRITLRPAECFREYIMLKLPIKPLYTAFLGNKVTQYLEKAAPGVREMVLLGKIWFERMHYDHVVVDMPSTGYALTMINTPFNFADLFPGGPVYHDSLEMVKTFADTKQTALVAVSLAEEMPVQESVELAENLRKLMPENPAWLVLNRLVRVSSEARALYDKRWERLAASEKASPLWQGLHYLICREHNQKQIVSELKQQWKRGWLELDEVTPSRETGVAQLIAEAISSAASPRRARAAATRPSGRRAANE